MTVNVEAEEEMPQSHNCVHTLFQFRLSSELSIESSTVVHDRSDDGENDDGARVRIRRVAP